MELPKYSILEEHYHEYAICSENKLCTRIRNQCAVRMSIALERSGYNIISKCLQKYVHYNCGIYGNVGHITSAVHLFEKIKKDNNTARKLKVLPTGKKGIILFTKCFERPKGSGIKVGNHIDLFDGQKMFNDRLKISPGGGEGTGTKPLFNKSKTVMFIELF